MRSVRRVEIGEKLPQIHLPSLAAGFDLPLRPAGRLANVIVTTHADCPACVEFVENLVSRIQVIRDWDAQLLVIVEGNGSPSLGNRWLDNGIRIATDPQQRLGPAGIPTPAVLVADQWGELFVLEHAGTKHAFFSKDEIIDWVRYLAIQCPECQGEAL